METILSKTYLLYICEILVKAREEFIAGDPLIVRNPDEYTFLDSVIDEDAVEQGIDIRFIGDAAQLSTPWTAQHGNTAFLYGGMHDINQHPVKLERYARALAEGVGRIISLLSPTLRKRVTEDEIGQLTDMFRHVFVHRKIIHISIKPKFGIELYFMAEQLDIDHLQNYRGVEPNYRGPLLDDMTRSFVKKYGGENS